MATRSTPSSASAQPPMITVDPCSVPPRFGTSREPKIGANDERRLPMMLLQDITESTNTMAMPSIDKVFISVPQLPLLIGPQFHVIPKDLGGSPILQSDQYPLTGRRLATHHH